MAESIPARSQHFSIVAIGPMNPRLHHPMWYKVIGGISEEEYAAALASPNLVVIPPMSQFEVSGISIACQDDRWSVKTSQPALRRRIKDIAALVFKKLFETPIQLYGFNNNFELETRAPKVAKFMANTMLAMDVGLRIEGEAAGTITLTDQQKSRKVQIFLRPSGLSDEVLSFGYNTEYNPTVEIPDKTAYWDLGEYLERHFEPDYETATAVANQVIASINRRYGDQ